MDEDLIQERVDCGVKRLAVVFARTATPAVLAAPQWRTAYPTFNAVIADMTGWINPALITGPGQ